MAFLARVLVSGAAAALASAAVAAACSRVENRHAARPMNAVAHIYDGGDPPKSDGPAARNTLLGFAIHTAASIWWAAFFEGIFGRRAERSTGSALAGGATIAAAAYFVDYRVVGRRFQPGFERYLSSRSMLAVYASLAGAFALVARLRRLHDHEVEDHDERDEGRHAEAGPHRVIAPKALRQRRA